MIDRDKAKQSIAEIRRLHEERTAAYKERSGAIAAAVERADKNERAMEVSAVVMLGLFALVLWNDPTVRLAIVLGVIFIVNRLLWRFILSHANRKAMARIDRDFPSPFGSSGIGEDA